MVEVLRSKNLDRVRGAGLYVDLDPPGIKITIIDKQGNQVSAHLDHGSIDLLRQRLQQVAGDGAGKLIIRGGS